MAQLEKNQILITISEDKKKFTIESYLTEITYDGCPAKPIVNIQNAINSFAKATRLEEEPEWKKEKCGYEGGECIDCN